MCDLCVEPVWLGARQFLIRQRWKRCEVWIWETVKRVCSVYSFLWNHLLWWGREKKQKKRKRVKEMNRISVFIWFVQILRWQLKYQFHYSNGHCERLYWLNDVQQLPLTLVYWSIWKMFIIIIIMIIIVHRLDLDLYELLLLVICCTV